MAARCRDEVERVVGRGGPPPCRAIGSASMRMTTPGNAVANSLAAVRAGARQIQGTLNGLGERCGNANLVTHHPDAAAEARLRRPFRDRAWTTPGIARAHPCLARARRVAEPARPTGTRPMSGASAFATKAGIHASAVVKDPRTYEHVAPESVGNRRLLLVPISQPLRTFLLAEPERSASTSNAMTPA